MPECVSPCSLAAEKGTYSKTFWWLDSGVPHVLVGPRGERLCGECWTSGYTSKVATKTSIVFSHIIGEGGVLSICIAQSLDTRNILQVGPWSINQKPIRIYRHHYLPSAHSEETACITHPV